MGIPVTLIFDRYTPAPPDGSQVGEPPAGKAPGKHRFDTSGNAAVAAVPGIPHSIVAWDPAPAAPLVHKRAGARAGWQLWDYPTWNRNLTAAKGGDRNAFHCLGEFLLGWTEGHLPRARIRSAEDREDVGAGFVEYVTRDDLAHLRDVGAEGWERHLLRALLNHAENWRRRSGQHPAEEVTEIEMPARSSDGRPFRLEDLFADQTDPEQIVLRGSDVEMLWTAMERLKEADRRLLYLRFWEDLTAAEIGKLLGKPRGTVSRRLTEVCRVLKTSLTERPRGVAFQELPPTEALTPSAEQRTRNPQPNRENNSESPSYRASTLARTCVIRFRRLCKACNAPGGWRHAKVARCGVMVEKFSITHRTGSGRGCSRLEQPGGSILSLLKGFRLPAAPPRGCSCGLHPANRGNRRTDTSFWFVVES